MQKMFLLEIIIIIFIAIPSYARILDTVPPSGEITSPQNRSIIAASTIRILSSAYDSGSGIRMVQFFAGYQDPNRESKVAQNIGNDSTFPYEMVWDCSKILDQSSKDLFLFCRIQDSAGNTFETQRVYLILDRNKKLSTQKLVSFKTTPKNIDGILEKEWTEFPFIEIQFDDNIYKIYSCWDSQYLYMAAQVKDRYVFTRFTQRNAYERSGWDSTKSDGELHWPWMDDCVSYFFDVNADHSELLEPEDRLLYISPNGNYQAVRRNEENVRYNMFYNWGKNIKIRTNINCGDSTLPCDSGQYVIEAAIPWQSLDVKPENGKKIGFEGYVVDRENINGQRLIDSWSCVPHNHQNPSEWGNLILEERFMDTMQAKALLLFTLSIFIGIPLLLFLQRRRKIIKAAEGINPTRQQQIIKSAEKYLQENFKDPMINRDKVAAFLSLDSSYFGSIFKKNTQKSLPDYLSEIRIKHAEELLLTTEKKVIEIAFEAGFGSLNHFIRTFRSIKGVTPNELRKTRA